MQNLRLSRYNSGRLVDGAIANQTQIAMLAGIEPRALRNIENGISVPKIKTLDAILTALDAYYPLTHQEKSEVWTGYGMNLDFNAQPTELPDEAVVQQAVGSWQSFPGIQNLLPPAPAILSDIAHRVLDFNALLTKFSRLAFEAPQHSAVRNSTIYDMIFRFGPKFSGSNNIVNGSEVLPSIVANWKTELWPYRREAWYWPHVNEARTLYPEFKLLWDSIPDVPPEFPPTRKAPTLVVRSPRTKLLLSFGILQHNMITDPRFRIIHLVPVDETTTLQCQLWAREINNK